MEPWLVWTLLVLSAFVVGVSTAGFGSGVGILAVPIMALAVGAEKMLGILLPVLILGDLLSLPHYAPKREYDSRNLGMILPGFALGIVPGVIVLWRFGKLEKGGLVLNGVVGGLCVLFVTIQAVLLWRNRKAATGSQKGMDGSISEKREPFRPALWQGLLVGAAAGLTSTIAHAAGPIVAMFLLSQRLDKRRFVGTSLVYFVFGNLLKLGPYIWLGIVDLESISTLPYLAPAVLAGTLLGAWMNRKLPARAFSAVIYAVVFATGVRLVAKVFGL